MSLAILSDCARPSVQLRWTLRMSTGRFHEQPNRCLEFGPMVRKPSRSPRFAGKRATVRTHASRRRYACEMGNAASVRSSHWGVEHMRLAVEAFATGPGPVRARLQAAESHDDTRLYLGPARNAALLGGRHDSARRWLRAGDPCNGDAPEVPGAAVRELRRRRRPRKNDQRMAEQLDLTIVYESGEDGGVIASIPEVAGVFSQGRTREEARTNVIDALRLMLSPESSDADDRREREALHLTIAA
jgi:predicted RNase H-like HicB family nuclease